MMNKTLLPVGRSCPEFTSGGLSAVRSQGGALIAGIIKSKRARAFLKNRLLYVYLMLALLLSGQLQAQEGESLFDPTYVHELHFFFMQDDFFGEMDELWDIHHEASGINVPYTKAVLQIDGNWVDTIGIRIKGLSSYYRANEFKKPFKVDLNEFMEGNEYDGMKKFNLHNGACDPGMLRDFMAYDILRTAGVAAPRVAPARIYFNGEYWGMYNIIEQIDKTFLDNNFADEDGTLIKNTGWDELHWKGSNIEPYLEDYEMKTNEDEGGWSDFIHFVDILNNTSDADFKDSIESVFDVDLFLKVMAVDVMTNNWDSYIDGERNYYLYHEPSSHKFHWIPWDYNLSLGGALTVAGNPYPPFDSTCYVQASFSHIVAGGAIIFSNESQPLLLDSVRWDFGDGQTSTELNPQHVFSLLDGSATVCLTAYRTENGDVCENKRCKEVNLGFSPDLCNSQINGSCPFPAYDPFFQLVAQQDDYCCEDDWDALCTLQYFELSQSNQNNGIGNPGVDYDLDYPLIIEDDDKVLIRRLMNVPAYRQRYLDICCVMMENNFTQERLFAMIDEQSDLMRPHILEDPNYIFTHDFYEFDIGNGTGGGVEVEIPALKWLLERRFNQLAGHMEEEGYNCDNAFSSIGWNEVVINEFAASNTEDGGIADPAGGYGDWIELYNNSGQPVELVNYYLSDDPNEPLKWAFPAGPFIAPGSYLIVWADKDEDEPGLHANFKLSAGGEFIMLSHEDGTVIDSLTFEQQTTNLSSARKPNGVGDFVVQPFTFMENNDLVSSREEHNLDSLVEVYPNPANEKIMLDFGENILPNGKIVFSLSNSLGQIFRSVLIPSNSQQQTVISTSHLPNGYYFIKVNFENEGTLVKKVVVCH